MVNTNPQVIYNLIYLNIGRIVEMIARNCLDINNNNHVNAINFASAMSEEEIKFKIWQYCNKLKIFTEDQKNSYQVEQIVLDLFNDSDDDSNKLHSFDFRGAICNMITLIYMLNNKVLYYDA